MVYLTQEGKWRGFVHPYDITTEMSTKKEAVESLRAMGKLYDEMLNEYDRPEHLANKKFSNPMDEAFYSKSINSVKQHGLCHVETLHS